MKNIVLFIFCVTLAASMVSPVHAADKEKQTKDQQKEQVYARAAGQMAAILADPKSRKIYGLKKLYENDDVKIYRGYDKKGRSYTFTKRK